jgi:16S rRNA (cytosine967-C5)-methyltransferase
LDLRVNRLRSTPAAVQAALAAAGVEARPIQGVPQGLTLVGRSGDLSRLPGFSEGHWCVQDRAAQRIAPLLDPQPGERILDACAAPGGKSTHLAELMGDQGTVLALDRGEARLRRVSRNADRLGLDCIDVRHGDATTWANQQPELLGQVDRILVDAPCSGLGTLARHADARWRIDPAAIDELVVLQRELLEGLLPLLKPQGRLVYATCTVHPRENAELIASVQAAHQELELLESWQLWPGEIEGGGDGFFAAVFRSRAR